MRVGAHLLLCVSVAITLEACTGALLRGDAPGGDDGGMSVDAGMDAGVPDAGSDGGSTRAEDANDVDADPTVAGDGGTDAGTDAGVDAGHDAGHDAGFDAGPPPCVEISPSFPSVLPPSNTLRLGGELIERCGVTHEVRAFVDGHPVEIPRVSGTWYTRTGSTFELTVNTWCWAADHGAIEGTHELRLEAYVPGEPTTVGATWTGTVRFSGSDPDPAFPWTAPMSLAPGADPGNATGAIETRTHTVTAMVEGAPQVYAYTVDVPVGYDPATAAPLLFSFTGWGPDTWHTNFAYFEGWREALSGRGVLHVIPRGNFHDPTRSQYGACTSCMGAYGCLMNQCNFETNWWMPVFRAVMADVVARYSINPARVYAAGFSCGGSLVHCLAMQYPGKFAAYLVMDANQSPAYSNPVVPDMLRRPPMLFVEGATYSTWSSRFGPGSSADAYCLGGAFTHPGSAHTWFASENDEALALFDASEVR